MWKRHFFIITLLLSFIPFEGNGESIIVIPAQKDWKIVLVKQLEVMPDDNNSWTFEKIIHAPDSLFSSNITKKRPHLKTYWARVVLKNPGSIDESITVGSVFWDIVTIYAIDSTGSIDTLNTGVLADKFNSRIVIPRGAQVELLAKFESRGHFRRETDIKLIISKTIPSLERSEFTNYLDGIIFGIILGLALYNLFLYFSLRDKNYSWYTVYLFSYAVVFFTLSGSSRLVQYFIPSHPLVGFYINNLIPGLIPVCYIQFTRHFLQSRLRYYNLDLLLRFLMGFALMQFLANIFGIYQSAGFIRTASWLTIGLVCVWLAFKSYLKGYEKAKFFLFGQIFTLVGQILFSLYFLHPALLSSFANNKFVNYIWSPRILFIGVAIEAIIFSFALANKYNLLQIDISKVTLEKELEKQEMLILKQKATELEMQALRAQMNPHFIFNSLNSINNFILKNDKLQASEYLIKFSKLIRMILENSTLTLISLEQELEALKLYIELEALRFQHRFDYKFIFSKDLDTTSIKVPPLILQPFVENAIHHGLMPKEGPGHLKITITEIEGKLLLKIEDDGIGRQESGLINVNASHKHKSLGLNVTSERIDLLNHQHAENSKIEVNDLTDERGKSLGTEININIPVII